MSEDVSNVIAFPKKRIHNPEAFAGPVQTIEDVNEKVQAVRQIHVDNVLDGIVETVIQQLIVGGFDVDEPEAQDLAFAAEALRAMMCRQYEIFHPFQEIADKAMFEDDDGIFAIVEGLEVNFDTSDIMEVALEEIEESSIEDGAA